MHALPDRIGLRAAFGSRGVRTGHRLHSCCDLSLTSPPPVCEGDPGRCPRNLQTVGRTGT